MMSHLNLESDDGSGPEHLAAQLLDELREAAQHGNRPDLDRLSEEFPDLAEKLPEFMQLAEGLGVFESFSTGAAQYMFSTEFVQQAKNDGQKPGDLISDFELIREIGRGGMGIVYEARQVSLNRRVALKVLPVLALLDEKYLKRFRKEAMAAGSLQHPNIVQAFSVGSERGIYFFAMHYIEGKDLKRIIKDIYEAEADSGFSWTDTAISAEPVCNADSKDVNAFVERHRSFGVSELLDWRELGEKDRYFHWAVRLMIQALDALEFAHRRGVIHRDIKPSNLMVDFDGKLWVTDFGLAQVEGGEDLTQTGDLLGTLRYMSPEQAKAESTVDHRTDVYSLGVTLYELLTLQPAFDEVDRAKLHEQVLEFDPPRLRRIDPEIPRDLELIVSKAMQKEPEERYATASDMCSDLQQYLDGESLVNRRGSLWKLGRRWITRNRKVATWGGSVIAIFAIMSSLLAFQSARLARMVNELHLNNIRLEGAVGNSQLWRKQSEEVTQQAKEMLYSSTIQYAHRLQEEGEFEQSLDYLDANLPDRSELVWGQFEVGLLQERAHQRRSFFTPHTNEIFTITASADGRLVAIGDRDGRLTIWRTLDWRQVREIPLLGNELRCTAFSPDGSELAVTSRTEIKIFDTKNWELIREFEGHHLMIMFLEYSPDGSRLYTAARDGKLKAWEAATFDLLWQAESAECQAITCGDLSQDGSLLVTGGHDKLVSIWDARTGHPLASLAGHPAPLLTVAFSPDGQTVVSGGYEDQAFLWDVKSARMLTRIVFNRNIVDAEFSSTGDKLAVADAEGNTRIYQPDPVWQSPRLVRRLPTTGVQLKVAAWLDADKSKDRLLITGRANGNLDRWTIPSKFLAIEDVEVDGKRETIRSLSTNLTGDEVYAVGKGSPATYYQLSNVSQIAKETLPASRDSKIRIRQNHLLVCDANSASFYSQRFGKWELCNKLMLGDEITEACMSRDGSIALVLGVKEAVAWDCSAHEVLRRFKIEGQAKCCAVSATGRFIAVGCEDNSVKVWSLDGSEYKADIQAPTRQDVIELIRFACHGERLVASTLRGDFIAWDLQGRSVISRFNIGQKPVNDFAVSPDGQTIALASDDLSLWRVNTGMQLVVLVAKPRTFARHTPDFMPLQFSGDGKRLVVARLTDEDTPNLQFWGGH